MQLLVGNWWILKYWIGRGVIELADDCEFGGRVIESLAFVGSLMALALSFGSLSDF